MTSPAMQAAQGRRTMLDRISNSEPIWQAHVQMVEKLRQLHAPKIFVEPEPSDFRDVGAYAGDVIEIVNEWFRKVGEEVKSNAVCPIDLTQFSAEGLCDAVGECNRAAAALAEDREYSR